MAVFPNLKHGRLVPVIRFVGEGREGSLVVSPVGGRGIGACVGGRSFGGVTAIADPSPSAIVAITDSAVATASSRVTASAKIG